MILYNPTVSGSLLVTGSLTTTGTITSQTLVVQTITSSIEFNTGSTRNGTLSTNTHEFTGSVLMSGSVGIGTTNISTEANLYLGAQSANEGGQLVLQRGTSYASASHLDNYQNRFRIMKGNDTGSTGETFSIDMATGVVELPFGQLKFPVTQNASSDANTLDDYEEGTFTPVPTSTGATFSTAVGGTYTKIGRLVYVRLQLDNISAPTGTLTNEMTITGLPFTAAAGIGYGASLAVGFEVYIDYPTGGLNIQARILAGTSYIGLRFTKDDDAGADFLASNFDWSDARIALSGCYEV